MFTDRNPRQKFVQSYLRIRARIKLFTLSRHGVSTKYSIYICNKIDYESTLNAQLLLIYQSFIQNFT